MKKKTKIFLATLTGCAVAGCAAYVIYKNKDEIIEMAEDVLSKIKKDDDFAEDFEDDFDEDFDEETEAATEAPGEEFVSWDEFEDETVEIKTVEEAPAEEEVQAEEAPAVEEVVEEEVPVVEAPAEEVAEEAPVEDVAEEAPVEEEVTEE